MNEEKMYSEEYVMDLLNNFRMLGIVKRDLEKENKQLKEELQKADGITQSCIFEGKEESTINFRECLNKLELYKEVIDEVREYINTNTKEEYENIEVDEHFGSLLQILDKAKENK